MVLVPVGTCVQLPTIVMTGVHAALIGRCKSHAPSLETDIVEAEPEVIRAQCDGGEVPEGTWALTEVEGMHSGLQNWQVPTLHSSNKHTLLSGSLEYRVQRG